ncbi:MAG: energy-coupling factor transporter transmembrane component T family protein [Candidatus Thorarchaeota archaeon]|nr:MAG: hypothetical protein DRP09_07275 [Candidatus Thorarchaeota archaeon]RLI60295.1 MAG: hypothetical protein DRO87_00335 [Candidatus Thorarchaeota archaeon]
MRDRLGYVRRNSWIHRLNPSLKLVLLVILLTSVVLYPSWKLSAILLLAVLIGFKIASVSLKLTRRRTQFVILFSIVITIFHIVTTPNGVTLGFLIPRMNTWGPFVPITDYGLERGLAFSLRFLLIILSSMLFVSVTDPTLLSHSLTTLGIPYRYTYALVISLRFLPLFDSESESVRMAQRARGIHLRVRGLNQLLQTIKFTFYPLLVSALSKVDSLSMSMEGKGFGYAHERTYYRKSTWRRTDTVVLGIGVSYLIITLMLCLGHLQILSSII